MRSDVAYRLRVYAPRSVDPTETTVLVPRAGAVHSDAFQVSSMPGVAGYQPYLDVGPRGRSSQLDPLEKRLDTGERVWRLIDARVGGANLSRWITAFLGDVNGGNQLVGCKVVAEESLDGGATWPLFATGRIATPSSSGTSKVLIDLKVRENIDALDNDVFLGPPASAVASYAFHAQVTPIGLLKAYGDFPIVAPMRGTVGSVAGAGTRAFRIDVSRTQSELSKTIYTAALKALDYAGVGSGNARSYGRGRVWVSVVGSGTWTAYDYDWSSNTAFTKSGIVGTTSLVALFARPTIGGAAPPSVSANVDFYVESLVAGVSAQLPLLINDVHPVTLLKHLCAGYYGRLDAAGAVTWSVPVDAASFTALEADLTIPSVRFRLTTKQSLRAWAEANLLKPNHLALRQTEAGELAIVDLRRSAVFTPAWALVDADLVGAKDSVRWTQDKDDALSAVTAKYYGERQLTDGELPRPFDQTDLENNDFPDISTVRIADAADYLVKSTSFSSRSLDVGGKEFVIDATGLRFRIGASANGSEKLNGLPRSDVLRDYLIGLASEIRSPFGLGPFYYWLRCRRASANAAAVKVGTTGTVDVDPLPDPATGLRGGVRVALCLSRTEDGPNVWLGFLDWGANSVAVAPTVAAPAVSADQPSSALTQGITINGAGQQARVDIAVTATSVAVRPLDTDAAWKPAATLDATGTATIAQLAAAGKRVWTRARSEPQPGKGFGLPSVWAYPGSGTGYVDLTVLAAPTAPASSSPGGSTIDFSWTVGDATLALEIFIKAGAGAPTGLETERVGDLLAAGSAAIKIIGLTAAATQYTVAVRHVDQFGNISALATSTVTTAAAVALATPTYPDGFSYFHSAQYGLAVIAGAIPSQIEFQEAVETAVASGTPGAYATVAILDAVAGDWTKWTGSAPWDLKRRWLKARTIRLGDTSSAYTTPVIVTPWLVADPLAKYPIKPPTATVTPILASRTRTTETLQLNGAIGTNDTGPLSWRWKDDDAAFSAPSVVALPQSVVVTRAKFWDKHITLEVTQADGQVTTAAANVPAEMTALDDATGKKRRAIANDDGNFDTSSTTSDGLTIHSGGKESGGKPVNRLLAKTLAGDVDTLDGLPEGTSYKRVIATAIDSSTNYIDFAGAGWKNTKNSANLPRSAADATAVSTIVQHVANTGHAASTMQESGGKPINRLLAKTLAGDVDHLDGVPEGTTYKRTTVNEKTGASRGYTALDSAGTLITKVDGSATLAGVKFQTHAKRVGVIFQESFEEALDTQGWINANGGTETQALVAAAGGSSVGQNVLRVTGKMWRIFPYGIPYNPSKLYRVRTRLRRETAGSGGDGAYIGFQCLRQDGTAANSNGGYAYVCVAGTAITSGTWTEFTGYFKGADYPYASGSPGVNTNPAAPTSLNVDTVALVPLIAVNWSNGTHVVDVDYYTVEELDENVSSRSEQVAFGATTKFPVLRHTENDNGVSGDTKTFTTSYDAVPEVVITGKVWTLPGASSTVDRKIEMKEINLTVSTYEIRAKYSTGSSAAAQTENPADTLNGTPANPKTISTTGTARYWNLSNANAELTTYTVNFDVDTTSATGPGLMQVKIYKNDGTSSTNWTQVASRQYDYGSLFNGEQLSFDAAMAANWDIRIVATWPGGSGWIGTVVTVKTCTYDKITAGTENILTPAGSVVFGAAKEKS